MTKPSEAALKAAQEIDADDKWLHMFGGDEGMSKIQEAVLILAARIDAAADEKYAELFALADKWDKIEGTIEHDAQGCYLDCAGDLRDALRKIKGEK